MSMCFQLIAISPQDIEKLSLGEAIEELLDEHFEARSNYALAVLNKAIEGWRQSHQRWLLCGPSISDCAG